MNDDHFGSDNDKTMPVCFSTDEFQLLEKYAKKRGMINCIQALESLVDRINST
jgi:hypothetical protein